MGMQSLTYLYYRAFWAIYPLQTLYIALFGDIFRVHHHHRVVRIRLRTRGFRPRIQDPVQIVDECGQKRRLSTLRIGVSLGPSGPSGDHLGVAELGFLSSGVPLTVQIDRRVGAEHHRLEDQGWTTPEGVVYPQPDCGHPTPTGQLGAPDDPVLGVLEQQSPLVHVDRLTVHAVVDAHSISTTSQNPSPGSVPSTPCTGQVRSAIRNSPMSVNIGQLQPSGRMNRGLSVTVRTSRRGRPRAPALRSDAGCRLPRSPLVHLRRSTTSGRSLGRCPR